MRAYLKNGSDTLNDPDELDTFMLGSNHFFEFRVWYRKEHHSKNKNKRHKYPQGQILITLTTFEDDILKESISRSVTTPIKNFRPQINGTR